jgi:single-strand DNA-binding protein
MTVVGNLVRDPELKFTNSGKAVCSVTVADSYRANREAEEKTTFMDVTLWGTLAENFADSLRKGNRVFCEGRVQQRRWETPEGEKRTKLELVADNAGPDLRFARASLTNNDQRSETPDHAIIDDESPF